MKRTVVLGIRFGLILVWLILLGVLITRETHVEKISSENEFQPVSQAFRETWLGIYFEKKKIGYSHETREMNALGGEKLSSQLMFQFQTMGKVQKIRTKMDLFLNAAHNVEKFRALVHTQTENQNVTFETSGEIIEKELRLRLKTAGEVTEQTIPLAEPIFLFGSMRLQLARQWPSLKVGDELSFSFFDPLTQSQAPVKVKILGKENETLHIQETFQNLLTTAWIDRDGNTLREISPLGFEVRKESREEALPTDVQVDLLVQTAVPFQGQIPRLPKRLRVELVGIQVEAFQLEDHRQKWRGKDLEIETENLEKVRAESLPLIESTEVKEFLQPSFSVQSDHPKIMQKAREIIGPERDALKVAKILNDWVGRSVQDDFSAGIPSALEVLQSLRGDCNEHTVLYVALARAIGLPARINVGLVFPGSAGMEPAFFYHAWPEVYVGQWLALDPTLGQFPADATHIRFVQGDLDRQVALLPVIGKLQIKVK